MVSVDPVEPVEDGVWTDKRSTPEGRQQQQRNTVDW